MAIHFFLFITGVELHSIPLNVLFASVLETNVPARLAWGVPKNAMPLRYEEKPFSLIGSE